MADVARLRSDMADAKKIVGDTMQGITSAAKEAAAALGLVGAGLSAAAVVGFVKNTIEATAKLRDLGVQAGMTVEQLSALAVVGKATGTGADMIASASNKLAKSLATSTEESKGAATALKALGLNFDAFQKLSPDQRIQQVAMAMGQFKDGGEKSAAAMLLFGKAGAEMLPFLKDLAQTGQLHAKVTTEQAEAAHEYEVALGRLRTQGDAWKKQIALEILPTLADITQELLNIKAASDGVGKSLLGEGIRTAFETIAALGVNVVYVLKQTGIELGGIAAQIAAILSGNWGRVSTIRQDMQRDAEDARRKVDQSTLNILGITNSKAGAGRGSVNPQMLGPVPDFHRELTGLEGDGTGKKAEGQNTYDALIKRIKEKIAAQDLELSMGRKLTEQEQFEIKAKTDLAEMMAKYPGLSRATADALIKDTRARADALAIEAAALHNNTNYAKQWAKEEEELAAARKQRDDEKGRLAVAMFEQRRDLEIGNEMLEKEAQLLGATDRERETTLGQLRIELDLKRQIDDLDHNLKLDPEARERLKQQATDNAELAKQQVAARAELNEHIRIWQSIDSTAHDVFVNIFQGGSNVFKKLGQTLKAAVLDLLYQMVVRKWVVNIVANVSSSIGGGIMSSFGNMIGGQIGGSIFGSGDAGGGIFSLGNLGGMAAGLFGSSTTSTGLGLLGSDVGASAGSLGSFSFGNWMSGGSGATTSTGLGLLGSDAGSAALSSIGSYVPYLGALYAASKGAYGAAAGTAIGTMIMPGIGTLIGAVLGSLVDKFTGSHGGPKAESGYGLGVLTRGDPTFAKATVEALQAGYADLVKQTGGTAGNFMPGVFTAMDPRGSALTQLDFRGSLNGQEIYNRMVRTGGSENVARGEDALKETITQETKRLMLAALQASDVPGLLGGWIRSVGDVYRMTDDEVTKTMDRLNKALAEKQTLEEQEYQLTHTAAEILARNRQREIDALDASNQELQKRIFTLQDEQALQEKINAVVKQTSAYLDRLNGTGAGLLPPEQVLANARTQFLSQLSKAKGGDADALGSITGYADQFLQAQVGYTASGTATQDAINEVKTALAGLPSAIAQAAGSPASSLTTKAADDLSKALVAALTNPVVSPAPMVIKKPVVEDYFDSNFQGFASGGVMTPYGPLPLSRYAMGGIADRPQVAIYGEGRMNEAYVPLPDGRSIPVTMKGGRDDGRLEAAINRVADGVSTLTNAYAAAARQQIDLQGEIADNTAAAARNARLDRQRAPA